MSNRKKVVNGLASKSGTQVRETKTERNHTKWNDDIFLLHPYFEVIVEGEGQYRFNCKLCQTNQSRFHSGWREGLKDHLMTKAHAECTPLEEKEHLNECIRLLGGEVRPILDDTHPPQIENPLSRERERELYFKLAQFIIKHHLPFSISEDLVELIQKINSSTDSSLLQRAHLSSTTVSRMTRECIGSTLKAQIFDELKQSYFSILTDVASDMFGGNYIGLLVRYIKEDVDIPVTRLLSVIEVGTESTGQSLYTKITQELFSNDLGLESKLIGVCTDNESKMISIKDKGLSNRLKDRIPYLVHVRDVCHGYNLACKAGLKEIPARFVSFVTKISAHFGKSVLRKARLRAIQSSHNQEPLDVHRFVPVRWLSLHQCCDRVLQLWPYLKEYFGETDCSLKEKFTKEYYVYTKLLSCLLGKLNHYNIYFQKDSLVSSQVLEKIQEGFTMFAQMLLTREGQRLTFEDIYARTDELIQIEANDMIDPIEEFKANFLARYPEFTRLIEEGQNELSPDFRKTFFSSAQGFVRNAIRVMREKLPFENEILSMAEDIYLERKDFQIATWRGLAANFPNIITPDRAIDYEEEIQRLNFRYKKIRERHESSQSTILKTWNLLAQDYPNVALLAKAMLVLPYTTSCVESTFSKFKVLKTPYRNRLSAESLEACILTEQAFAKEEPEILPQMLVKYQNMWRANNAEEQIDATIIDPSVIDLPEIIASEQASQRLPDSDTDNLDDEIQTIVYTKQAGTTKRSANLVRNVSGEKKVKKNNPS